MGENICIAIVDREENSRNILKSYLSDIEGIDLLVEFDSTQKASELLSSQNKGIVILDTSENIDKAIEDIKQLTSLAKDLTIIATTNKVSTDIIIKTLRAGAKDIITKPFIKTELTETIKKAISNIKEENKNETCKVISTFSNKGGIGKTSIAVNLALELAQATKEKVALIDLNLQLGDVATFLDMTPTFAMDYIADNIDNLGEDELLKTLSRYKNTSLYVIADPINIDKSRDITANQIKCILDTLKRTFSYIVIDIGTNIDTKTITALDMSDLILLIAIVNLPAIRSTQRCMDLFEKLGYSKDKVKLILNRHMENEDIKTTDIEDVVQQKVYWKIPNNYLTMVSAINKGVPVSEINPESNLARNYKEFSVKVSDYLITQKLNKMNNNQNFNI